MYKCRKHAKNAILLTQFRHTFDTLFPYDEDVEDEDETIRRNDEQHGDD